jgi:lipid II:glycine glycyltransferase (peptidoglycan interpeptide bridge formation enzyme)
MGDVGIPIFSATGDDGLKYRGSYLLRWTMLTRMKERGCRILDQGGVNPEKNPGGYHFKSGMGGRLVRPLGRFDLCGNPAIGWALSCATWVRKLRRRRVPVVTTAPEPSPGKEASE